MKKKWLMTILFLIALIAVGIYGCASIKTFMNSSTTKLSSSSLASVSALRAQGVTIAGTSEGSNWLITPTKISGKVLSVVLPVGGQEDEGVVPFGDGRPDIAPAQSTLYDFDLSEVTSLHKDTVGLKPGYVGGNCEQIILLFGYFDVEFLQGTTEKKIRMIYGDTGDYLRGDKLMYNPSGETAGSFYWYSTTESVFVSETATRPADACVNNFVKEFSDPVRPNMHYYLLGAQLRNNTDYDGVLKDYITLSRSLVEDNDLTFTVDFDVQNAVVFSNVSSAEFNALTDAQLIEKFDMKQNVSAWSESNLYCSITFEATPKY